MLRQEGDPVPVEFQPDLIEPRGWRIKGVGMYGSDVDVISLDQYQELVQLYRTNMAILHAWADSALRRQRLLKRMLELRSSFGDVSPLMDDLWQEIEKEATP